MNAPWLGMAMVMAALGLSVGGVKWYETHYNPKAELTRKLVHIVMGLVTLTFPWLFTESWPVVVLGVLSVAALSAVRYSGALRKGFGTVLHGVDRKSSGELYFPVAVTVLFCLTNGDWLFYVIPILMLTFADSTAALIGASYGRKALAQGTEDAKSLEGSFVFFNVAFMSTLVPVLLFTEVPRAQTLALALMMGVLAALIELISQHGNDNILIPLMGYAFLKIHMGMETRSIVINLAVLLLLFLFARIWNRRGSMSRVGIMGGVVGAYLVLMLGDWTWLALLLLAFLSYPILPQMTPREKDLLIDYPIVASNMAVPLLWTWLGFVVGDRNTYYYLFIISLGCHQAMNTYVRLRLQHNASITKSACWAWVKQILIILIPGVMIHSLIRGNWPGLFVPLIAFIAFGASIAAVHRLSARNDYGVSDARIGWMNALVVLLLTMPIMAVWR